MKIPFSWLKEYVEIDVSPEQLEEKLFSCGFEVEECISLGKDVENVVVCRIERCEKHPDADRLTVCQVDCGELGKRQIVTAATNISEGAFVPVALDGATVKEGEGTRKIKAGKLRGVLSEGMFCSGEELGITDDYYEGAEVDGVLILDPADGKAGEDIRPVVGIDDVIFDIALTANRPDCMSVLGIAREVAAVLQKPLHAPSTGYTPVKTDKKIGLEVRDTKLCPRYIGHYVKDVQVAPSPRWMRRRLAKVGVRSLSNLVDITNYVLFEIGQPMHAFDRTDIRGDKIVVRRAEEGEKIVTLDGKEFSLHPENLLICDGERPVALAGVMGGKNSEIGENTHEVFFEAASFARDSVRKTSRALGQRSDSSARFERGVDPLWSPAFGMARALHLIEELHCGKVTSCGVDACAVIPEDRRVKTSYRAIDDVLGIHVPKKEVNGILSRLGFEIEDMGSDFSAKVPLWRQDIEGYPDLAEEVIRMYGYDHIVPTFLERATVTHGGLTAAQRTERKCKNVLKEQGYFETCTYSFCSPKDLDLLRLSADAPERRAIRILNPIGEDLSIMRTILVPSMIWNVVRNVRRGNAKGKLFELANVYLAEELPLKELPEEREHLVLALWGEGDFFDLKGGVEAIGEAFGVDLSFGRTEKPFLHPGISAEIRAGEREIGWIGELHPAIAEELALDKKAYFCELDYVSLKAAFAQGVSYRNPSAFPFVERDLAVVVDEERTCAEIQSCILRACKAVKRAELFDVYRDLRLGAGKKSMAFRLTFAPDDRAEKPLSPETVDGYFHKIVGTLSHLLGAELR